MGCYPSNNDLPPGTHLLKFLSYLHVLQGPNFYHMSLTTFKVWLLSNKLRKKSYVGENGLFKKGIKQLEIPDRQAVTGDKGNKTIVDKAIAIASKLDLSVGSVPW